MAQDNTQGTLSSMIPQGTPSAPTQQPPSFGQKLLGNKEYSVEINDAVMETEAWRSSRYNGRQLEASQINVSKKNDIGNNDKSPIIQRHSKNIYIGNRVIGFDDDPTQFNPTPGFKLKSFINVEGYFTINSDDTVSKVGINFNDTNSRKGFERSFREDFSVGTKASIIILDKGVEHNLKDKYTVDFNEGLLSRILEISSSQAVADGTTNLIITEDLTPEANQSPFEVNVQAPFSFDNPTYSTQTYNFYQNNESLYFTKISGSGILSDSELSTDNRGSSILTAFFKSSRVDYLSDPASNKFFLEIKSPTNNPLPSTFNQNNIGLQNSNVVELDFNNSNIFVENSEGYFTFRLKTKPFNTLSNPFAIKVFAGDNLISQTHFDSTYSGIEIFKNVHGNNFIIHKLNPIPSILINLSKEEDLPNGIGEQGFIIIPENFDPGLKPQLNKILKNKLNFDIEGGVNTNDDTNPFRKIFGSRKN